MICLTTVLQRYFNVRCITNVVDNPVFSNAEEQFIHGLTNGKPGTCANLPVLYATVARQLGYPLKLVRSPEHLFARWDDGRAERFNVECTVVGFESLPDEYYLSWPKRADPYVIKAGKMLQSLTPRDELGSFLHQRALCFHDNERYKDAVIASLASCLADSQNALFERASLGFLRSWQHSLRRLLPYRYPALTIRHPVARCLPDRFPVELERSFTQFQVVDDLLHDTELERKGWGQLRCPGKGWPTSVPTEIKIAIERAPMFHPERNTKWSTLRERVCGSPATAN